MKPRKSRRSKLTAARILTWADRYSRRTGAWPTVRSGPIPEAPGYTWMAVEAALRRGLPGLGPTTLARFLAEHRGVRNRARLPPLTEPLILGWLAADFDRTGI